MAKIKKIKSRAKYYFRGQGVRIALVALVFGLVGLITLILSMAASNGSSIEPEQGTLSGNVCTVANADTSGSGAIGFGCQAQSAYGNDKWLFVGDSISAMSINDSIASAIKAASPERNPVIVNAAVGGSSASTWADSDPALGDIDTVLAANDAKFVVLALGTNDYQPNFKTNYKTLIDKVIAAGKTPVLPYMPWGNGGNEAGKEAMIDADIEILQTPQSMRGANLFAATYKKTNLFQAAGDVHPNAAGQDAIRQAWVKAMLKEPPTSTKPNPYATITTPNLAQLKQTWITSDSANNPPHDSSSEPTGNFRTFCSHSHYAYDDPVVYPGQLGAAHLHNFYGNPTTNYASTYASLRSNGTGTCQGGPLNRTGYWVPAMFNGNGKLVVPYDIELYYKGNGTVSEIKNVHTNPNGLRMIAGHDMTRTVPGYERGLWYCDGVEIDVILEGWNCANGKELKAEVRFPMCWDGKEIDSANHRSHMAYGTGGGGWITAQGACPSTHPIHLPELTLKVRYTADGNTGNWYLSSDRMPGMTHRNGETWHADWFGAWDPEIQNFWTQRCIRELKSCVWGEIGDGTRMKNINEVPGNTKYNGPWTIDAPAHP